MNATKQMPMAQAGLLFWALRHVYKAVHKSCGEPGWGFMC